MLHHSIDEEFMDDCSAPALIARKDGWLCKVDQCLNLVAVALVAVCVAKAQAAN